MESVGFNFSGCHPGYSLNTDLCTCRCDTSEQDVERCDSRGRYIYLRVSDCMYITIQSATSLKYVHNKVLLKHV